MQLAIFIDDNENFRQENNCTFFKLELKFELHYNKKFRNSVN